MTRKYIQEQLDIACKNADFDEVKKWGDIRRDNSKKLLLYYGHKYPINRKRCLRDYMTIKQIENTEV